MNDLDPIISLISGLTPDIPLAPAEDLAPIRRRLMTAVAAGQSLPGTAPATGPAPVTGTGKRPRNRPGWQVALAGTAAGAAAAGIAVVITLTAIAPSQPARPSQAGRASGPPATLPVSLAAAQFLHSAATAAARQPAVIPRPKQFIFTEIIQASTPQTAPKELRKWISVNGSRRGLVEPQQAVPPGRWKPCTLEQSRKTGCAPTAAFLPDLPANQAKLLAYLRKTVPAGQHMRNWTAYVIGQTAWNLETQEYLLPAQRAAIFQVMTHINGLHLARHVVDPVGRDGVGIWWRFADTKTMLIFDPASYAFLALVSWPPPGSSFHGTVTQTLVKMTIVSKLPRPANQVTIPYRVAAPSPSPAKP